jgi:hypothetical protein
MQVWRGETFAATTAEYFSIKTQLASETFAAEAPGGPPRFYSQLPQEERAKLLRDRLKKYCQRVRTGQCPELWEAREGQHVGVLACLIKHTETGTASAQVRHQCTRGT